MFKDFFKTTVGPYYLLPVLPFTCVIQDKKGKAYFKGTREKWFGKPIEEFSPEGPVRDAQWKALETGCQWDKLAAILDKNGNNVTEFAY